MTRTPRHRAAHRLAATLALPAAVALLLPGAGAAGAQASVAPAAASAPAGALPASALEVLGPDGWQGWWRADQAATRWTGPHPALAAATRWTRTRPGVETATLELAGRGEAWRTGVVLVRLDPAVVRLRLDAARFATGRPGPWSVDRAPDDAAVAFNGGQFTSRRPWGWVVHEGREIEPPGTGPLAAALTMDAAGRVRIVPADGIAAARASGTVVTAIQSYPALLAGDGDVLPPLRAAGLGVDVAHRDSRLAVGVLRDGRLLVALTRFRGLGGLLSPLPLGLTVPETAALMGALGCREALLLDGGVSGQLLVRDAAGRAQRWDGWRDVPLGVVAVPIGS